MDNRMTYEEICEYVRDNLGLSVGVAATTVTVAAIAAYLYMRRTPPKAIDFHHDLNNQSVEIEPGVRMSCVVKDGKLLDRLYDECTTLYECFLRGVRVSGDKPYLGYRKGNNDYQWITYNQARERSQLLGSTLLHKGLKPGDFLGIFSQNRPEWMITENTCSMFSLVTVPLYDTLGKDACAYIINQTDMRLVICDTVEKARILLLDAASLPSLKTLVVMNDVTDDVSQLAAKSNIQILTFAEAEVIGKSCKAEPVPPKPDDTCTICYTSGTTGNPKGVVLSHGNLVSNLAAVIKSSQMSVEPSDVHISYLPLAHMFERCVSVMIYQTGARIGYFRGDVKLLTEDMMTLKPTIFPTVPRLLNRVHDKVLAGVSKSKIKSMLYHLALSKKQALLKKGIVSSNTMWDKLVFNKIQRLLGGRVRFMITAAAPISPTVLNFARCALGCVVVEGYGQTEATAGVTFTFTDETLPGHVGPPLPCNYVKLADVEEMDYYAADGKGEVCVKGLNVMKGYYREPEKTKDAIDADGWLHTGDIGMWLPNGTLKIVDRKKHIFKLAQGEYIAPEKIENVYVQSELVAQAFVDGSSLQPYLLAIIVPDLEVLPKWAETNGIKGDMDAVCNNPALKKVILEDIISRGKKSGLQSFEQVKDIYIHNEMFSVENGLLTPTFKSKRPVLKRVFEKEFETMYSNLNK